MDEFNGQFQIVIPSVVPLWFLEDCIQSMGEIVAPVLVVDNTPDSVTRTGQWTIPISPLIEFQYFSQNIGCTAAWNLGLRKGAPYTLICSTSVRWSNHLNDLNYPDYKDSMRNVLSGTLKRVNEWGLKYSCRGYHFICFTRKTIDTIGEFDENLVNYGNDDEAEYRLKLAGITFAAWGDECGVRSVSYGVAKRGGYIKPDRTNRTDDWYTHKWGGWAGKETHKTPFGNPNNPISYWPKVHH